MRKEVGAGALAAMLVVTGPMAAELTTPNPIVEKGVMPSQGEIDITGQKEIETVNQRFVEFLAGEGEYSDEKLELKLFGSPMNESDLGFNRTVFTDFFAFQAVLLFHKNIDGEEILALGLKNRKRDRVVTVVTYPVDSLIKLGYGLNVAKTNQNISWLKSEKYDNESEISLVLDEKIGSVLSITMDTKPNEISPRSPSEEYGRIYNSLFSNKAGINRGFLTGIWRPEVKNMSEDAKGMFQSVKNKGSVLEVENYSDFLNLANRIEDLPFILNFYYQ